MGKVPNSSKSGTMRTQFSDNVIGEHDLTFFDTDYENYAAFFTCQSVVVGHRRSASIISRTPLLASRLIAKARGKLMSFDIDLYRLKRIDQHPCSYLPTIMGTFISNSSFTQISDFNSQIKFKCLFGLHFTDYNGFFVVQFVVLIFL